jgi:hypothetical protein
MKDINNFVNKHMMTLALVIGLVILGALVYLSSDKPDPFFDSARAAVEAQGYTDIQYVGRNLFACGVDARAGYEFEATRNDNRARLVACFSSNAYGYFYVMTKGQ